MNELFPEMPSYEVEKIVDSEDKVLEICVLSL